MTSRAVAARATNGSDKQRTAKPALADSAQGKAMNSVLAACNKRHRWQSRRDPGIGQAPLCQAHSLQAQRTEARIGVAVWRCGGSQSHARRWTPEFRPQRVRRCIAPAPLGEALSSLPL
jgi:hypothetical protein